jgi:DNA-binding CsgD family transcriptional regulator
MLTRHHAAADDEGSISSEGAKSKHDRKAGPGLWYESECLHSVHWSSLIDAIGTCGFEPALRNFLRELAGPSGWAAFFHEALGQPVAGCGCGYEGDHACQSCLPKLVDSSPHWVHFDDSPWRAAIAVALPGTINWQHSVPICHRLVGIGVVLAAMLRKHMGTGEVVSKMEEPLSSLQTIESCLADCTGLPLRERQVCARILYGLSSAGIGVDLALRESTVKTYRKRAYDRLRIGSERELITWYLRFWNRWTSPVNGLMPKGGN